MMTLDEKTILEFARAHYSSNVKRVVKIGYWEGYEVWEPTFGYTAFVGLPITVLVKGDSIRLTQDAKETLTVWSHYSPDNQDAKR